MGLIEISRRLSFILRHGARETGIAMDAAGWVRADELCAVAGVTRAQLDDTILRNDKARLERDGDRVRAAQGHSLAGTPVTREALEASWARWRGSSSLWHGTRVDAIDGIAEAGIVAGERTHVHLAPSPESRVGKRSGVHVLLEVGAQALAARGLDVFESANGVLLVRHVPAACIVGLRALSARARRDEARLRVLLKV
jgi:putative RNA 2'-phosphotransferase